MRRSGFTLIEVLVVMVVMAILVGTAVTSLGAGMKSARMRDATRAVQQYVRHAKAVALLKQRPVVVTFEEITEDGAFVKSRISMDFSADAAGEQGATPLGQGFSSGGGGVKTLAWHPGDDVADESADPPSPAAAAAGPEEDALAAPPREFEGIHIRGELQENREESRARISVFSNVDVLRKKSSAEKEKAAAAAREKDPAADAEKAEEERDEDHAFSAVYEANGRCDPYVVRVWKDGDDEHDAMTINVGRFGHTVTGN